MPICKVGAIMPSSFKPTVRLTIDGTYKMPGTAAHSRSSIHDDNVVMATVMGMAYD